MKPSRKNLPKSVTSGIICTLGLVGFMVAVYLVRIYNINQILGAVLSGLAYVLPIVIFEFIQLKTFRRSSTGLVFNKKNKIDFKRVMIKLLGLYSTLALVVFFYWLFPEYKAFRYEPFFIFAKYILVIIIIGSIPYHIFLDKIMIEPEDSHWKLGMIILGRKNEITYDGLKTYFLGWLVKAFFLPLMFESLCNNIVIIKSFPFSEAIMQNDFMTLFNYINNYIFTIDLVVVSMGYLLTLRILDSHNRSVEPSFLGWFVALICYKPFWDMISPNYFPYNDDGFGWWSWLWKYENILMMWGIIILILFSIYTWSSLIFGLRFSNLTHRGIITNGPYRYMRHPAYVSKNIAWWLIAIPFISEQGFLFGLRSCLLLLAVNIIYFFRAKTEERHLSFDPTYVEYATIINETGIFRKLFKLIPFLRYNPEQYINVNSIFKLKKTKA